MKHIKIFFILLFLSFSSTGFACWDDYEDDYYDDWYDDWYDDYYDDDDDWNYNGGYLDFGNGLFYDENNDTILCDWNDDGIPDSVWMPDVDVYPNNDDDNPNWEGGNSGNSKDDDEPDDDHNNNTPNKPSTNTSTNKKTAAQIADIAKKSVSSVISRFGTTKAYCNVGVNLAFNNLYSKNDLSGKCANDMVKYWQNNPGNWEQINLAQAQSLANQGYFVVAGWVNPTGGSGHVVVIVPGETTYSPSWGMQVPNSMDTGANMRTPSQPLSHSFGASKKDGVLFYKYK